MSNAVLRGEGWIGCFPEERDAPIVYAAADGERAEDLLRLFAEERFAFVILTDADWNRDLSPWRAPKVFKSGEDFGGCAEAYLKKTLARIPLIETGREPIWRGIAGYSLAGLFAVWSLFNCGMFDRAASASGSMWFDGFLEYIGNRQPVRLPQRMTFSLGDREANARNPRMAQVAAATEAVCAYFRGIGVPTVFHWENGNHFNEPDQRLLRAIWEMACPL